MRKRTVSPDKYARLMSRADGAAYCGMGLQTFTAWAKEIGAERRFGRRVLFDRVMIDKELDSIMAR